KNRKMLATASRPFRISLFKTGPPLGFPPYVQRLYHEPTPGTIRGRHGGWADEGGGAAVIRQASGAPGSAASPAQAPLAAAPPGAEGGVGRGGGDPAVQEEERRRPLPGAFEAVLRFL